MFGDTFCAGVAHTSIAAHRVPYRLHLRGSVGCVLCLSVCVGCVCVGVHMVEDIICFFFKLQVTLILKVVI